MKFADEFEYLIHLLSCAIHDRQPEEKPGHIAFEDVLALALTHEVANFAFLSVKKLAQKPDEPVFKRWQQAYYMAVMRDLDQSRARTEILNALHSRGIATMEVQGTVVKRYYPAPHLRMMSDLDFIIRPQDLPAAGEVLTSLGYEVEDHLSRGEVHGRKGSNLYLEIHSAFVVEGDPCDDILGDPFAQTEVGEDGSALVSDTLFYEFHLVHTVKHLLYAGVGLRRMVDLYYMQHNPALQPDREAAAALFARCGYKKYADDLIALSEMWFNDGPTANAPSYLIPEIRAAGNHGTAQVGLERRLNEMQDKFGAFVRLRYILSLVFARKFDIYQSYPICAERQYSLLRCWLYRWRHLLFDKDRKGRLTEHIARVKSVEIER